MTSVGDTRYILRQVHTQLKDQVNRKIEIPDINNIFEIAEVYETVNKTISVTKC